MSTWRYEMIVFPLLELALIVAAATALVLTYLSAGVAYVRAASPR